MALADDKLCEDLNSEIAGSMPGKLKVSRKCGSYTRYSPKQRLEMARYSALHDVTAASRQISKMYSNSASYNKIQRLLAQFKTQLKVALLGASEVKAQAYGSGGRTPSLGTMVDADVVQHLRAICSAGG